MIKDIDFLLEPPFGLGVVLNLGKLCKNTLDIIFYPYYILIKQWSINLKESLCHLENLTHKNLHKKKL
jgi:hypothetical protein